MLWNDYKAEFSPAQGLNSIYVEHTTLEEWQATVDFLRGSVARMAFYRDDTPTELPAKLHDIFASNSTSQLLVITLDTLPVYCRFPAVESIRLEFDPAEITSEARARIIFRLMSTIGRTLRKEVILAAEGHADSPVFKYEPGSGIAYLHSN